MEYKSFFIEELCYGIVCHQMFLRMPLYHDLKIYILILIEFCLCIGFCFVVYFCDCVLLLYFCFISWLVGFVYIVISYFYVCCVHKAPLKISFILSGVPI